MLDLNNNRVLSYKKNCKRKRPGEKIQVNLILQEFGRVRVMSDVDMKMIDYINYAKEKERLHPDSFPKSINKFKIEEIRNHVEKIINDSFCSNSVGRISLCIELIKKMQFSDLLEIVLNKIKVFVKKKISKYSKKIKKIFSILKKLEINVTEFIKGMEDDFKFPSQLKLAYRMAAVDVQ